MASEEGFWYSEYCELRDSCVWDWSFNFRENQYIEYSKYAKPEPLNLGHEFCDLGWVFSFTQLSNYTVS